jgi:hypothetical protein
VTTLTPIAGTTRLRAFQLGLETSPLTEHAATRRMPWSFAPTVDPHWTFSTADTGTLDEAIAPYRMALDVTGTTTGELFANDVPTLGSAGIMGGISAVGGNGISLTVTNSTFNNNSGVVGGAIDNVSGATATLINCLSSAAYSFDDTHAEAIVHPSGPVMAAVVAVAEMQPVTGAEALAALPDLPTVAEAGLPGYEAAAWYAVFAPARTSKAIVDKVSAEFARAIKLPDVRERIEPQLIQPVGAPPAELAAFLGKELKKWGAIVKESGAKVE